MYLYLCLRTHLCVCETSSFLRPGYSPHGEIGWNRFWVFELARAAAAATGYGETHSRPQFAPWNWPHKGKDIPSQSHILNTLVTQEPRDFQKFWPMHLDETKLLLVVSILSFVVFLWFWKCLPRKVVSWFPGGSICCLASILCACLADKALVFTRDKKGWQGTQFHCDRMMHWQSLNFFFLCQRSCGQSTHRVQQKARKKNGLNKLCRITASQLVVHMAFLACRSHYEKDCGMAWVFSIFLVTAPASVLKVGRWLVLCVDSKQVSHTFLFFWCSDKVHWVRYI